LKQNKCKTTTYLTSLQFQKKIYIHKFGYNLRFVSKNQKLFWKILPQHRVISNCTKFMRKSKLVLL